LKENKKGRKKLLSFSGRKRKEMFWNLSGRTFEHVAFGDWLLCRPYNVGSVQCSVVWSLSHTRHVPSF